MHRKKRKSRPGKKNREAWRRKQAGASVHQREIDLGKAPRCTPTNRCSAIPNPRGSVCSGNVSRISRGPSQKSPLTSSGVVAERGGIQHQLCYVCGERTQIQCDLCDQAVCSEHCLRFSWYGKRHGRCIPCEEEGQIKSSACEAEVSDSSKRMAKKWTAEQREKIKAALEIFDVDGLGTVDLQK